MHTVRERDRKGAHTPAGAHGECYACGALYLLRREKVRTEDLVQSMRNDFLHGCGPLYGVSYVCVVYVHACKDMNRSDIVKKTRENIFLQRQKFRRKISKRATTTP
jgi:hypothetical protein